MGLVRRKWYRFVLCATIIAFLVACYLKLQSLSNSKGKKANLLAVCHIMPLNWSKLKRISVTGTKLCNVV